MRLVHVADVTPWSMPVTNREEAEAFDGARRGLTPVGRLGTGPDGVLHRLCPCGILDAMTRKVLGRCMAGITPPWHPVMVCEPLVVAPNGPQRCHTAASEPSTRNTGAMSAHHR